MAIEFEIENLGVLPGHDESWAHGINDAGHVVGYSEQIGGEMRGFLYGGGVLQDLGALAAGLSIALDVNNHDQVVGHAHVGIEPHAFLWTPGGTDGDPGNPQMKDLGTLGGAWSIAHSINDAGQVVGASENAGGIERAFLWTPGATDGTPGNPQMKDLGTLGGAWSRAHGIDPAGHVVGTAEYVDNGVHTRAFRWTSGGTGGVASNPEMKMLDFVAASSIRKTTLIAGAMAAGQQLHPCLHHYGSTTDLGVLAGSDGGVADAVNAMGWVVGRCNSGGAATSRATLFRAEPPLLELNDAIAAASGWDLQYADAINDGGQIACTGVVGGVLRAALLTPIPDPTDRLRTLAEVTQILWGIVTGGPGVAIPPGGRPVPVPPPNPVWQRLAPRLRDSLLGIVVDAVASSTDASSRRRELRAVARGLLAESIDSARARSGRPLRIARLGADPFERRRAG